MRLAIPQRYLIYCGNKGNVDFEGGFIKFTFTPNIKCLALNNNPLPEYLLTQEGQDGLYVYIDNIAPGETRQFYLNLNADSQGTLISSIIYYCGKEFVKNFAYNLSEQLKQDGYYKDEISFDTFQNALINTLKEYPNALTISIITKGICELLGINDIAAIGKMVLKIWEIITKEEEEKKEEEKLIKEKERKEKYIQIVTSRDPNEKTSSSGFGESHFIPEDQEIYYIIYFENLATATAPAQKIVIIDIIAQDLDKKTLIFDSISLGDRIIELPEGLQISTSTIFSLGTSNIEVETNTVRFQIDISFSTQTRTIQWTLEGRDINTGELTDLLVPNHYPPNGEGYVSFKIKPKQGLLSKTKIKNKASIVFDTNPSIDTPEVFNTIDSDIPTSTIKPLPQTTTSKTFNLEWTGNDDSSGIKNIMVYSSDNDSPCILYQTIDTQAISGSLTFKGEYGHIYRFYSRAKDGVGNLEAYSENPDCEIMVIPEEIRIEGERAIPIFGTTSLNCLCGTDSILATWTLSSNIGTLSPYFGTNTIFYATSTGIGTITATDGINTVTTNIIVGFSLPLTYTLTSYWGSATIRTGTNTETLIILPPELTTESLLAKLSGNTRIGVTINAYGTSGNLFKGTLTNPVYIEINYNEANLGNIDKNTLALYISSNNGNTWKIISYNINPDQNIIIGTINHFSIIAPAGGNKQVAATNLNNVIAYPNPCKKYLTITFANLTKQATIKYLI